ncbi:uncharacterized protein N7477_009908 [Penicillium maclennaniae]|uniref:uncharacterized protein n=1 Tax=Penicillium maclennaniae TaxID=1343394 RepID=UPI002540B92F|nr:uncharacterized protein N7477_009908 [Penicillium maclennaniae]KAJ5662292.1 hypothetical protein N7477_009908 [Penicillium maclennaniae]
MQSSNPNVLIESLNPSLSTATFSSSPLRYNSPSYQQSQCARRHNSNAATSSKENAPKSSQRTAASTQIPPTSPPSSISEHVRLLMRRVPYPVAIITATDPTGPADTSSFRGMTVSSFSAVTLSPDPVISFNVRRPSETLNALLASGRFLVHLLAPGPDTATLARDFSKGNTTLSSILNGHGDFEFRALDVESKTQASEAERPLPILRRKIKDSKELQTVDFPFVFECTLHPNKIDVHDHSIVLGTVVRAIEVNAEGLELDCSGVDENSSAHLCLTYANTRFWKMGSEI